MSLRDLILAAVDRPLEKVAVPEWGGAEIFLRPLSLGASMAIYDAKDATRRAVLQLVHSTCDESGQPIFSETDADLLVQKSATVCMRLLTQIHKIADSRDVAAAGEGSGATASSETNTP